MRSVALGRMGDSELLERFADRTGAKDEPAELAFATLVERHGPMVLRVCHAGLGNPHEAEDAFQATFLVLAQKAGTIHRGRSVASWLHGVALRVSHRARARAARRDRHERGRATVAGQSGGTQPDRAAIDRETWRIIDEEVGRLPERFRRVVVLCYLEGLTHEMAADQLGCPVGTVRSRLATARARLDRRLRRRGLGPEPAQPGLLVPAALAEGTIQGALHAGAGKGALAAVVSAEAAALTNATARSLGPIKAAIVSVLLAGALIFAGVYAAIRFAKAPENVRADTKGDGGNGSPARDSDSPIAAALDERDRTSKAFAEAYQKARSAEEKQAVANTNRKTQESLLQKILDLAAANPKDSYAEEALVTLGISFAPRPVFHRAIELLVRDHIKSESIEPLFRHAGMMTDPMFEFLCRAAIDKSPHPNIQGLACYRLARFLEIQASFFVVQAATPGRASAEAGAPPMGFESARQRLERLGPHALDDEAIALYTRVINEFIGIPSGELIANLTDDEIQGGQLASIGENAQIYLADLITHGVGKPAPEIEGLDINDQEMRLSDFRGKVVILYFGAPAAPGGVGKHFATEMAEAVDKVARQHAKDPVAVLGVSTVDPGASGGRESYQWALKASGSSARFWWDLQPYNRPGPIQAEWNARRRARLFVIDPLGVIRHNQFVSAEQLEKAVSQLLAEPKKATVPMPMPLDKGRP
jgi:RNA polymerase sigma factor (sigma-70 family)